MINGIRVKICGLTTAEDAALAAEGGADFLGFNLWPKSPRHVTLEQFEALAPRLPARGKVAVLAEPALPELQDCIETGFDFFQIHFAPALPPAEIEVWSRAVGRDRLWLAPKLSPGAKFDDAWLRLADTFLLDTYQSDGFGGTGRTGDWAGFAALRAAHPRKGWILAGGLTPQNVAAALAATGARQVDLSSGVERAPGVKDPEKLRAFFAAVRAAKVKPGP